MNRDINLKPWNEVCLITKYEHHTLIDNATVLIENSGDYFYSACKGIFKYAMPLTSGSGKCPARIFT